MDDWISVEDSVPEETWNFGGTGFSDDVIVLNKDGESEVTHFVYPWRNMKLYGFSGHQNDDDILYWCPIPRLPKEFEQ